MPQLHIVVLVVICTFSLVISHVTAVTIGKNLDVKLSLFVNGVSLEEVPFIDQRNPRISWKINSRSSIQLKKEDNIVRWKNLRQVSYQVHINGVLDSYQSNGTKMHHTISTNIKSNKMYKVIVNVVLSNGGKLEKKGVKRLNIYLLIKFSSYYFVFFF